VRGTVNAPFTLSVQSILRGKVYAGLLMGPVRALFLLTAGLLSIATATPATAAPVAAPVPPTARADIRHPATVRLLNDLNFGNLTVTSAGTDVVSPADVITTTGGVLSAGGNPYSAMFEAVAPVKSVVHVRIANRAITVTRVGGTETMTVDTWTMSGSANRNVVAREPFAFTVGGTLHVNANQAEGLYVGTFDVEIQYN